METTNRLEEITARYEAATPGPWAVEESTGYCNSNVCIEDKEHEDDACKKCPEWSCMEPATVPETLTLATGEYDGMNDADAEFIAHARSDIPWLKEQLDARDARTAALEKALNGCCWACAKAKPWEMHPDRFPNISTCEHRKHTGNGNMRGCLNWVFDQARFTETQED